MERFFYIYRKSLGKKMLTKKDKELLRGTIFRHLDGIATATTTFSLYKKGALDFLLFHEFEQIYFFPKQIY